MPGGADTLNRGEGEKWEQLMLKTDLANLDNYLPCFWHLEDASLENK